MVDIEKGFADINASLSSLFGAPQPAAQQKPGTQARAQAQSAEPTHSPAHSQTQASVPQNQAQDQTIYAAQPSLSQPGPPQPPHYSQPNGAGTAGAQEIRLGDPQAVNHANFQDAHLFSQPEQKWPGQISSGTYAHPASQIQMNAQLRELYMRAMEQLRIAESRETSLKEENLRLKRNLELASVGGVTGDHSEDSVIYKLKSDLADARDAIANKDLQIVQLEQLCKSIGNEHDKAVTDAKFLLENLESDTKVVETQREQIEHLKGVIVRVSNHPAAEVEHQRMQAEINRLKGEVSHLNVKLHTARSQLSSSNGSDEMLEQLRRNGTLIQEQSQEIRNQSEQIRILKKEKLEIEKAKAKMPGKDQQPSWSGVDQGVLKNMRTQLLENAITIARLQDELAHQKLLLSRTIPEANYVEDLRTELTAARERVILLEAELQASSEQGSKVREELWEALSKARDANNPRSIEGALMSSGLQDVRRAAGH